MGNKVKRSVNFESKLHDFLEDEKAKNKTSFNAEVERYLRAGIKYNQIFTHFEDVENGINRVQFFLEKIVELRGDNAVNLIPEWHKEFDGG